MPAWERAMLVADLEARVTGRPSGPEPDPFAAVPPELAALAD